MNISIIGAAGFIGTNLSLKLAEDKDNNILLIDEKKEYFANSGILKYENVRVHEMKLCRETNFTKVLEGQDIVYHLVSTTIPVTSNRQISKELDENIDFTVNLLDECVSCNVNKIIFISSGGTVYGKEGNCPLKEDTETNPITSYGVQKLTIEKLLYLYHYMHGIDYRVIRLANPYGPYQRPNGVLGAVTTFTYKALNDEEIMVYGDGSVVRDYIFIDDAINAITTIADSETKHKLYNVGCGYGTSIKELLDVISVVLEKNLNVVYCEGRTVDVPENYLDINRYETEFGKLSKTELEQGIKKTAEFMIKEYDL